MHEVFRIIEVERRLFSSLHTKCTKWLQSTFSDKYGTFGIIFLSPMNEKVKSWVFFSSEVRGEADIWIHFDRIKA